MINNRNSQRNNLRNNCSDSSGFALLAVIGVMAIVMALTLSLAQVNLSNVKATMWDSRNQQAAYLLDSGLRYAALSIASPRIQVASNAIPKQKLVYKNPIAPVRLTIENEAGRIDLANSDTELLASALRSVGVSESDLDGIQESLRRGIQGLTFSEATPSSVTRLKVRDVWSVLRALPIDSDMLWQVATIGNAETGVNPALASPAVLALVPGLSSAQQQHILASRDNESRGKRKESLIGLNRLLAETFENKFFTGRVSSDYRIKAAVVVAGHEYSKTWIVKMVNQASQLFEITAQW